MTVMQNNVEKLAPEQFSAVYKAMLRTGDEENAFKIMELYEKYYKNEFIICFSGHFSAGKSSIINHLLDKDVLPKSPIPTSANIVKITSGEGVAKIYFKDDEPVQYKEPYNIDTIKDYCMDRDTIRQIEISTKEAILPQSTAIFDSPGIDAADDADRLMTESAIHLIDLLFYVMDYNHVQSEVNLYFLQKMQKLSIPYCIIINQVDKHIEAEVPFTEYDRRVKQTFDQWGIAPKKVYYTTIVQQSHPKNNLIELKKDIFHQLENPVNIQPKLESAVRSVIKAHQIFLKNKYEDKKSTNDQTLLSDAEIEEFNSLENQLDNLEQKKVTFEQEYTEEVQMTLKNAYLMPRPIRDLAESFLVSQEKDFKVGLFQSKKKTHEEQQARIRDFENAVRETLETTIQWKLREKIISFLQKYGIAEESLLETVQHLQIQFGEKDIFAYLKHGAKVNGNYVLNYTNDLSAGIKTKYRTEMNELWRVIESYAHQAFSKEKESIMAKLSPYKLHIKNKARDNELEEQLSIEQANIVNQWESPEMTEAFVEHLDQVVSNKNQLREEAVPEKLHKNKPSHEKSIEIKDEQTNATYDIDLITSAIDTIVDQVSEMKGFKSIIKELYKKQDRLKNRQLTIALFGTFSAGKSSFSNALFGERVLPVSPNPTTAVINRISPVTETHPHGTVNIAIKSRDELSSDLEMITKHVTNQKMNLDEWIHWIKKNNINEHEALSKTYQAYLNAVITGYEAQKSQLGDKVTISLNNFADYVTDESKACFISEVDLYYDCAVTRKGITLVDTPGADSVNARHTNVAFDYIKEADAILYVTYYNHAITKGDRDFLIQLGRVKEAFEMDKMFFIVNASDLAESASDLKLVVNYVEDQLLQFGIRNPKIFPVSSKISIKEKMENSSLNTEMKQFEDAFYSFIDKDLLTLTVDSAIWDMNRARKMLEEFIKTLELNETEREQKIASLQDEKNEAIHVINKANMTVFEDRFMERIDRQLHFVLERLYIRFHDMFTDFFNPSTINDSGKKAMRQLEHSRNQFIDYVGYEMLQEVRAVSLRIEAYMRELLHDAFQMNQEQANKINSSFIFPSQMDISFTTPIYKQAFENIDMDMFQKALKIYKNMKSFFEQNEREQMKSSFYDILKPETETYLETVNQQMKVSYGKAWHDKMDKMKQAAKDEIELIVEEHTNALYTAMNMDELKTIHKQVERTIDNIG